MAPREIVVDGTDGGGKSPLVANLVTTLSSAGLKVGTQAPYRVWEVYPLWESDPIRAARTIVAVMQAFRSQIIAGLISHFVGPRLAHGFLSPPPRKRHGRFFYPFQNLPSLLLNRDRPEACQAA